MKSDRPPSTPPGSATALLKDSDFFRLAKAYGGLAYLGSMPGSPAERAQLKRGDVVLAVNGHPTPDLMSFLHARGLREGGVTVRYVRDGEEGEVELVWDARRATRPPADVQ